MKSFKDIAEYENVCSLSEICILHIYFILQNMREDTDLILDILVNWFAVISTDIIVSLIYVYFIKV